MCVTLMHAHLELTLIISALILFYRLGAKCTVGIQPVFLLKAHACFSHGLDRGEGRGNGLAKQALASVDNWQSDSDSEKGNTAPTV